MLWKLLIGAALAGVLLALCWLLRGIMLTPVRPGAHIRLQVILRVDGPAPGLEQTVNALVWLRSNGTLPAQLLVADEGMDPETARVARALARQGTVNFTD